MKGRKKRFFRKLALTTANGLAKVMGCHEFWITVCGQTVPCHLPMPVILVFLSLQTTLFKKADSVHPNSFIPEHNEDSLRCIYCVLNDKTDF